MPNVNPEMSSVGMSGEIRSLTVKNFTAFSNATLDFSRLNVIVGENGVGKTHLLKLLYAVLASCQRPGGQPTNNKDHFDVHVTGGRPTVAALETTLSAKLVGVFRPKKSKVGRLARRRPGHNNCSVKLESASKTSVKFGFSTRSSKVNITACPGAWSNTLPVFLPPHELLSLAPGFIWLYDHYATEFDETWYDTRKLLGAPSLRRQQNADTKELSNLLKKVIGGTIVYNMDDEHFYLRQRDILLEMFLVAEGIRKVGTLSYLIATGHMDDVGCLFWDEPESNLNPKIIRIVADAISRISRSGTQVFVATHNLFLLRELELIQRKHDGKRYLRYFALEKNDDGVVVNHADDIYHIEPLVALDEANAQSERFIAESQKW